jgi:hypothetical protein
MCLSKIKLGIASLGVMLTLEILAASIARADCPVSFNLHLVNGTQQNVTLKVDQQCSCMSLAGSVYDTMNGQTLKAGESRDGIVYVDNGSSCKASNTFVNVNFYDPDAPSDPYFAQYQYKRVPSGLFSPDYFNALWVRPGDYDSKYWLQGKMNGSCDPPSIDVSVPQCAGTVSLLPR